MFPILKKGNFSGFDSKKIDVFSEFRKKVYLCAKIV